MICTINQSKTHKHWDYKDFKYVLDQVKTGKQKRLIASEIGRSKLAVSIVVGTWRSIVAGKVVPSYNPVFINMAQRYISEDTSPAKTTTAFGATPDPFEKVNAIIEELQTAIVEAIIYGANQKADKIIAEKNEEIRKLRIIQDEAKKSNIAGMLRRTFRIA